MLSESRRQHLTGLTEVAQAVPVTHRQKVALAYRLARNAGLRGDPRQGYKSDELRAALKKLKHPDIDATAKAMWTLFLDLPPAEVRKINNLARKRFESDKAREVAKAAVASSEFSPRRLNAANQGAKIATFFGDFVKDAQGNWSRWTADGRKETLTGLELAKRVNQPGSKYQPKWVGESLDESALPKKVSAKRPSSYYVDWLQKRGGVAAYLRSGGPSSPYGWVYVGEVKPGVFQIRAPLKAVQELIPMGFSSSLVKDEGYGSGVWNLRYEGPKEL